MRTVLLALTITVILSLAFSGVLVLVANAAAPGDALYEVDRGLEAVQMGLARSEHSANQLQSQLAAERLGELQSLAAHGDQQHLEDALEELGAALSALEEAANAGALKSGNVADLINAVFTSNGLPAPLDDNDNINDNDNANDNSNDNSNDNTNDNDNANESTKDGAYCRDRASGKHHPVGDKLAERYEVGYDEIMGWFCDGGYGFGEIDLAYRISLAAGVTPTAVFDQRATGEGWGNIIKDFGLDKKPDKPPKPPKPDNGNGSGNGNGNAGGNGNGQGNGLGNGQDKNKGNNGHGNKGGKGKP